MKRFFATGILFTLLIGITSLAPASKYKYYSEEANCTITFPAEYTTQVEEKDEYKSVQTQAIDKDMIFMMIYSKHNQSLTNEDELCEISFGAFMEGLGGNPSGKETWKLKKHTGLKSEFDVSREDLIGDYRVVIIGQIQYQIVAVSPKASWDAKKATKFFKSFKVGK